MTEHDPLCPAEPRLALGCFCELIARVRANERAERGLANEPQGLALAEMLLHASRATDAKVRADLRAQVEALPNQGSQWIYGQAIKDVLDLIDGPTGTNRQSRA